ncbi:MAG: IS200/IS605 family transposase [Chloracidobacterium sp.]|nr:IS200/IS605 family transposase [Chloracidobacterium sp.]
MPQSLAHLFIHIVFSTKHRQPLISEKIEPELYAYVAKILYDECHSPAVIIGGDKDHLHILLALSRIWSIAKVIELIKKRSSKWIKTKGKEFAPFQWQTGYGAFSVSKSSVPAVKKYIENQKEHHQKKTFEDEFIGFLEKHGIGYDERYVWD